MLRYVALIVTTVFSINGLRYTLTCNFRKSDSTPDRSTLCCSNTHNAPVKTKTNDNNFKQFGKV